MSKRYNVWLTDEEGLRSLLMYRNRTAWTFRTAIKHAEDFVERLAIAVLLFWRLNNVLALSSLS